MPKYFLIFPFFAALFSTCLVMENPYSSIPPGIWRATLELVPKEVVMSNDAEPYQKLKDNQFEEVSEGELPFNFEVVYKNETDFYIEIINGEERIRLDDISTTHDRATNNDTIIIRFPVYGTYIKAAFEDGLMEGKFYNPARSPNYAIPFRAKFGKKHRFTTLKKEPLFDVNGKWETTFGVDESEPYKAIGEFKQEKNKLTGTFITETGDYRFLDGTVQANKLYLSCFDGSHAFLFEAKLLEDSTLIGSFRSGNHYKTLWEARKNSNFELANPDSLTYLKEGYETVDFTFENPEGKMVSINDERYQNKIKIVQIFGTWCPNCRDETNFLVDYLKENKTENLEIIALAFEKFKDKEKAMAIIQTYKDQFEIPYEILYAGISSKKEAAKSLPMLNHILSFPTMIFIDRENKVRRIHTGFSGPATSKYEEFKNDFDHFVKELLAEQI
jgi:thiol-disulfide isomerase/thioredoxin